MKLIDIERAAIAPTVLLAASSAIAKDWLIHAATLVYGIPATPQRQESILPHDEEFIVAREP